MTQQTNPSTPSLQRVLQANWIHSPDVERWLQHMSVGSTLNVCCGSSRVGNVRVDIDPTANRTEEGDLFNLRFQPLAFDTVICDPPFSLFSRFDWINNLSKIARRRFLLAADRTIIRLPKSIWKTRLFAFQGVQSTMYLRLYYCFDRANRFLLG